MNIVPSHANILKGHFLSSSAPQSPLANRLLFHLSHKFNDEKRLMSYHQNLRDVIEDQLSLASIHYLRSHYQEAIDIYKRILLDNRLIINFVFMKCIDISFDYFCVDSFTMFTCSVCCSRDYLALNVYVALCYYKLDYYDVSQVNYTTFTLIFHSCIKSYPLNLNYSRNNLLTLYITGSFGSISPTIS